MMHALSLFQRLPLLMLLAAVNSPLSAAGKFDLTPEQQSRMEKYLPHCFGKLAKHDPLNVLIIGDDVAGMKVHNDDNGNILKSFAGTFVGILADQFFYTGGVRVVRPPRGQPEKSIEIIGPEISLRNATRNIRLVIHGLVELASMPQEEFPDLVILNFGVNEALQHSGIEGYRRALQKSIDLARQHKADIILLGPTLTMTEPLELGLALTRPYAETMREVAEKNQVFFADLGDIAWLARVDERMKGLEKPQDKKNAGTAVPKTGTVAPGPVINMPMPDEIDPDPDKRAARLFRLVCADLQKWFDHGSVNDPVHPTSAMHRLLGRRIYAELLNGARKVPWSIGPVQAVFKSATECVVSYRIENNSDEAMRVTTLPLVTAGWKPVEAETQADLKPAQKALVVVTYRRTTGADSAPSNESELRLPTLVLGESWTRIETLHASIHPVSVQWNTGAQFNVEKNFTIEGVISNPGTQPQEGTWEARCLGQRLAGKFSVPARGRTPVKLLFNLPSPAVTITRQKDVLNFVLTTGELSLPCNREIEVAQNIGLKQAVPLFPRGPSAAEKVAAPAMPDINHPGVTFRTDADPNALYLTWDIFGINLADNPDGSAATAEVCLDARSYGSRLTPGITSPLRAYTRAADGDGTVAQPLPWAFGIGYGGKPFKATDAGAHLSSRPDGSRRFTLMIPRNSFYLHEWALGNGNSELGLNASLSIWQKPDDRNPRGSQSSFVLVENSMSQEDAESLAALELTEHPTQRWTVRLW